jgi:hypothetical protein
LLLLLLLALLLLLNLVQAALRQPTPRSPFEISPAKRLIFL